MSFLQLCNLSFASLKQTCLTNYYYGQKVPKSDDPKLALRRRSIVDHSKQIVVEGYKKAKAINTTPAHFQIKKTMSWFFSISVCLFD